MKVYLKVCEVLNHDGVLAQWLECVTSVESVSNSPLSRCRQFKSGSPLIILRRLFFLFEKKMTFS